MALANLVLHLVVLVLNSAPASAMPTRCEWYIPGQETTKSEKVFETSLELFQKTTAGNFPDECYEDNMKLMFPAEAYILPKESQHQDFVLLAHEALSYIFSIIQNNLKSVPWDRDDVDHFQGLIFRQMEELEKCMDVKITSSGDSSSPTKGKMLLKTYFETLEKLLKDKGYNICAWEIIRKEVLHNLQDFHKFLKRQKN